LCHGAAGLPKSRNGPHPRCLEAWLLPQGKCAPLEPPVIGRVVVGDIAPPRPTSNKLMADGVRLLLHVVAGPPPPASAVKRRIDPRPRSLRAFST